MREVLTGSDPRDPFWIGFQLLQCFPATGSQLRACTLLDDTPEPILG